MGWLAAILAVLAAGSAVHQGEQVKRTGRKARLTQETAQRQSLLSSVGEERAAAQAERKANRRRPDVASILFQEQASAGSGVGSTILAGRGGGRSLLGSKSPLIG